MKVISNVLGFIILILVLFNILRVLTSLVESYFNMNFGIDGVLHNHYVIYGALAILAICAFLQELIEQRYNNNEHTF